MVQVSPVNVYKSIRNLIMNEFKITNDEMRDLVRECIQSTVQEKVEKCFKDLDLSIIVREELISYLLSTSEPKHKDRATFELVVRQTIREVVKDQVLRNINLKFNIEVDAKNDISEEKCTVI